VKLLLASKSSTRRRMLQAAGVPFECVESGLDEEEAKAHLGIMAPKELAGALALAKAGSVTAEATDLVLGSDQVLEREDGTTLSKPSSPEDAFQQLRSLAGRAHRLHSAAAVIEAGKPVWQAIESVELAVRPLSDHFLRDYLAKEYEAIRWSVGGYRIEGLGAQLFERIEGSHFAILGLPLLPLLAYLRLRGLMAS
jgi:septum formation protein